MKVVATYENEVRALVFDQTQINFKFEINNRVINSKSFELRNINVGSIGLQLENLAPVEDAIETLRKIEIYSDDDLLIKESEQIINVFYRLQTGLYKAPMLTEDSLTTMYEIFVVDIK